MKPSRVKEVLNHLVETRWPAFLWGAPGVGKSSIMRQIAEARKLELVDIRASLLDPTDLRGIPVVEDGLAKWCPPSFLPSDPGSKGILFFDELNAAAPLVQASLYQLTLDRKVGEYTLPDGWRIVAAGNRAEDASITFRMPSALANRFIHIDFEVDFNDWNQWAVDAKIHPLVLGFLNMRRELLLDLSQMDRGFPTPRSWEIVSDVIKKFGVTDGLYDVLLGIVGEGASIEFSAYCDNAISHERILKIIANPADAPLPRKLGDQYALISYVTSACGEKRVRDAAAALLSRLKPELAILLLRNVLQNSPRFLSDERVKSFMGKHQDLVL